MNKTLFQETQRFTRWWLWLLLLSVSLTIYRLIYAVISEGNPLDAGQWIGVIVLTVVILWEFPPKKINHLYRFRTRTSMKSQRNWDFAQKYAGRMMVLVGFSISLISVVLYFLFWILKFRF